MTRKEIATMFLKLASSGDVKTAYDKFVGSSFIHHNQYFAGDRQSLLSAMEEAHQTSPNKSFEVRQIFEDGDSVITHSLVKLMDPEADNIAVVHIFRFQGDKIVELWDLAQLLMKDSPNKNGPF